MTQLFKKYKHAWVFLYAFIYLPWFFYLEESVKKGYRIIHTWADDLIPFNEYFIVPYLLWFVYVAATVMLFFFKSQQEFYRLCTYLFTGMTLSLIICTLFPNGTDLRPAIDPDKNIFCGMIALLHKADTSTNIFPSIHVYNSIAVHVSIVRSQLLQNHRLIRLASLILAVSICLSTVFLKQHSVVDLLGGIIMAYGLYPLAYGKRQYSFRQRKFAKKALG